MNPESIMNELKNLAENMKAEMSANVYEYLWNMVQRIEHDEAESNKTGEAE